MVNMVWTNVWANGDGYSVYKYFHGKGAYGTFI